MGYIKHNAIIVTSCSEEDLKKAHGLAYRLFDGRVSEIIDSSSNGYASFLIPPDGSKEGWDTSNDGDDLRDEFFQVLKHTDSVYDAVYPLIRYMNVIEVRYGGDDYNSEIVRAL